MNGRGTENANASNPYLRKSKRKPRVSVAEVKPQCVKGDHVRCYSAACTCECHGAIMGEWKR